ncbi:hypothetical protein, partial [Levilactobacillus namurensis]|uniref:hypothetical protein n=1 Tax=Levilactobacillus namurensis TaxID=380393 RepID=UPI0026EE77CA
VNELDSHISPHQHRLTKSRKFSLGGFVMTKFNLGWVHCFEQRRIEDLKVQSMTSSYSSWFKVSGLKWRK